jgi:hypothetical protein
LRGVLHLIALLDLFLMGLQSQLQPMVLYLSLNLLLNHTLLPVTAELEQQLGTWTADSDL